MISIPSDLESRDISQWLEGGWFFVKLKADSEELTVCTLHRLTDSSISVVPMNGTGAETVRRNQVFPHWPVCGALNMDGYVVVLRRLSQRQYRRTYNSRCLGISIPRKWDTMKQQGVELATDPNDPKVIAEAFSPTYYPYSVACDMLADKAASVALNPHLVVAGKPDAILVYYRGKMTGHIVNDKLIPIGCDESRTRRLLKFFDGRITL